jgi:D-3-phosphoglycerate dehydrogenase
VGRPRVVLLVPMLHPDGEELLRRHADVVHAWELDSAARADALAGASAIGGRASAEDIASAPNLVVIGAYGSGLDGIDVAAATAAGVTVVNAAGAQATTVAEHGVALMLAFARRVVFSDRALRTERRFPSRQDLTGDGWPGWPTQLRHKVVGIVGYGHIGRELARKCRSAFDMEVLACSPRADPGVGLHDLLERSDYVVLTVPLTPETTGMIGQHELGRMKRSAVLVNLSRGATVDTSALVAALRDGVIAGAALDVFDPEPLPPDHPLLDLENIVVTPHIGGWAAESVLDLAQATAGEILRVLAARS